MRSWLLSGCPRPLFSGGFEPEYVDPKPVAQWTEDAWSDYPGGQIGKVVAALPRLIKTAQQMEAAGGNSSYKRQCAAVSARIHHLAATTLSKVGEADFAWNAAERAMQATDTADDPLILASAAQSGTHALLAVGRFDDAMQLRDAAARWLTPRMKDGDLDGKAASALNVRTRRGVLFHALQHAVALGELGSNPLALVKAGKAQLTVEVDPRVVVNPAQARQLLAAVTYVGRNGWYSYLYGCLRVHVLSGATAC